MADSDRKAPPMDFATFCLSIGTTALVSLGIEPDPETGERELDLELAKQNIEILDMLEDKTKGNLTEREKEIIQKLLYDLRMSYVRISRNQ